MAANYWGSSQRNKWQCTRESLAEMRSKTREMEYRLYRSEGSKAAKMMKGTLAARAGSPGVHAASVGPRGGDMSGGIALSRGIMPGGADMLLSGLQYDTSMRIYIHNLITGLGRQLRVRQRAIATAETYVLRFFTRVSILEVNIYSLVAAALYLACKIEECPLHIRGVALEARNMWPHHISNDISRIAEFEFYLIEEMDSYLIVYHPYDPLKQITDVLARLPPEQSITVQPDELHTTWSMINDTYITDLMLFMPPHIIAVACLYMTMALKSTAAANSQQQSVMVLQGLKSAALSGQSAGSDGLLDSNRDERLARFIDFLAQSNIHLEEVIESIQEIISLYESWEKYNESKLKSKLNMFYLKNGA